MYLKTKRIKKTFLVFFLVVLFGITVSIFAKNNSDSDKNVFLDTDQDGLSDQEELVYGTDPKNPDTDGDGYSDGTEVKSGYDPLKPAPGDKIVSNNDKEDKKKDIDKNNAQFKENNNVSDDVNSEYGKSENLTEELSAKLAVVVSSDNIETKKTTVDELNNIIDQAMSNSEITFDDLPKIDKSEIKIKKQKYSKLNKDERNKKIKQDNEKYLIAVSYLIINNVPYRISSPSDIDGFTKSLMNKISEISNPATTPDALSYFRDMTNKATVALQQLKDIEVPEDMIEIHIKGLQILSYAIELGKTVKINHNDPVKSIMALGSVQSLLVLANDFFDEVNKKFTEMGISLDEINI